MTRRGGDAPEPAAVLEAGGPGLPKSRGSRGSLLAFERAVLALAALICGEDIPCDRCRNIAAAKVSDAWTAR